MQKKVHQLTDSIHGTIYVSEFEHQMMSTPFFYRLNDVYQSSTVYMTFPSNRTKRYEHSLGTMELAGQMFYAAVTNSIEDNKLILLNGLKEQFEKILICFKKREDLENIRFYQVCSDDLSKLVQPAICSFSTFSKMLADTIKEKPLYDHALVKQEVCFFDLFDQNDNGAVSIYSFLYQCALQALRLAALFHDIGHPPFSHIIEYTLQRICKDIEDCPEKYNKEKVRTFNKTIGKYLTNQSIESMILENVKTAEKSALHEQIGLDMLYNAFRSVLNSLLKEWVTDSANKVYRIKSIYFITVVEFTFGILLEKNPIFGTLHRIIDGPIDADRMDYIVRDSVNSGVHWGSIPYQRVISSIKMVPYNNHLCIAFPEKVTDDIDDLIVNRYKVFQRINYHHKCIKSSELMQKAVETLSKDYLSSDDGCEILPEIKNLWCSLGPAFGQDEKENQISRWTDAWLISALSNALICLGDLDTRSKLIEQSEKRSGRQLDDIYTILNEVLLNKKRYFPLLKRQRDAIALKDKIKTVANTNNETLQKLSMHEYEKLINQSGEEASSAQESLYRINILQQHIFRTTNLGLLDVFFCGEKRCQELIKEQLDKAVDANEIEGYFICPNIGYNKLGFDDDTEIILFRHHGDIYKYDVTATLKQKIISQRSGCLWLYVYLRMPRITDSDAEKIIESVLNNISESIGNSLKASLNDLFNFEQIMAQSK